MVSGQWVNHCACWYSFIILPLHFFCFLLLLFSFSLSCSLFSSFVGFPLLLFLLVLSSSFKAQFCIHGGRLLSAFCGSGEHILIEEHWTDYILILRSWLLMTDWLRSRGTLFWFMLPSKLLCLFLLCCLLCLLSYLLFWLVLFISLPFSFILLHWLLNQEPWSICSCLSPFPYLHAPLPSVFPFVALFFFFPLLLLQSAVESGAIKSPIDLPSSFSFRHHGLTALSCYPRRNIVIGEN